MTGGGAEHFLSDGSAWPALPSAQDHAVAAIRRSSRCADLAQQGYFDVNEAMRDISNAMLAVEFDRPAALSLAHAWLAAHIPSGMPEGTQVHDVDRWVQRIRGPHGSAEDRRWLAWGVALAVAELSARTLPWEPSARALVETLVCEGYDPAPWERRELSRSQRLGR